MSRAESNFAPDSDAAPVSVWRSVLRAHVCIGVAGLIGLDLYLAWRFLPLGPRPGLWVILTGLVASIVAVACLIGAMALLDRPLSHQPPPGWYLRVPLKVYKRVLLLAQLAATALILWAAGILIFGFALPQPR